MFFVTNDHPTVKHLRHVIDARDDAYTEAEKTEAIRAALLAAAEGAIAKAWEECGASVEDCNHDWSPNDRREAAVAVVAQLLGEVPTRG